MSGERGREKEKGDEVWEEMRRGWTRVKVEANKKKKKRERGMKGKSGRTGEERGRGRVQEGRDREPRSQ